MQRLLREKSSKNWCLSSCAVFMLVITMMVVVPTFNIHHLYAQQSQALTQSSSPFSSFPYIQNIKTSISLSLSLSSSSSLPTSAKEPKETVGNTLNESIPGATEFPSGTNFYKDDWTGF